MWRHFLISLSFNFKVIEFQKLSVFFFFLIKKVKMF